MNSVSSYAVSFMKEDVLPVLSSNKIVAIAIMALGVLTASALLSQCCSRLIYQAEPRDPSIWLEGDECEVLVNGVWKKGFISSANYSRANQYEVYEYKEHALSWLFPSPVFTSQVNPWPGINQLRRPCIQSYFHF